MRCFVFGMMCAVVLAAAPSAGETKPATPPDVHMADVQPLRRANAYSLELDGRLRPAPGYFPLGMLGDHGMRLLPFIGFNLTETIHTCYAFREDKPCTAAFTADFDRGLYFFNVWAAHTLYRSRSTAKYGELKNSLDEKGNPHRNHQIRFLAPDTRRYVLDAAAHTVKEARARGPGDKILMWGIDNEWESPLDYSPEARERFHAWLPTVYGNDLERFRQAWGGDLKAFSDARPPTLAESRDRKGPWLDWRRFQEESYTDFIRDYFAAIQNADPKQRPVVSKSTQVTLEMVAVARKRVNNHELLAAKTRETGRGWYAIDLYGHGDRNNYELNYLNQCQLPDDGANPAPAAHRLFATETNNHSGPGWQWAQVFWRNLASGVKAFNFFHLGKAGAVRDYATFGFTYPSGARRDKFFYAARFAAMIHRTEAFWATCVPQPSAPRLAILLPQRDIQLAAETGVSWWDYSDNNRLKVYKILRDAGYWVDAIPYGKLNPEALARYQALFLVGAEHLSAKECADIARYVEAGGTLVSDTRPGYYDEHHLETRALDPLLGIETKGIYKGIDVSPDDIWYNTPHGNLVRVDGKINYVPTTGQLLNARDTVDNAKGGHLVRNAVGKGQSLWFNTRLGVMRAESGGDEVLAAWLGGILSDAGVKPAYAVAGVDGERVRVETPLVDAAGNLAVVIAGTTWKGLPEVEVRLPLAGYDGGPLFFAGSEDSRLQPVTAAKYDGEVLTVLLPPTAGAGALYAFKDAKPLMGVSIAAPAGHPAADPHTPQAKPGDTVEVTWQLANPSKSVIPAGRLKIAALEGWTLSAADLATDPLAPGAMAQYKTTVTIPAASPIFEEYYAYPVTARWSADGRDQAVMHGIVTLTGTAPSVPPAGKTTEK